jgi:hypothetical protein
MNVSFCFFPVLFVLAIAVSPLRGTETLLTPSSLKPNAEVTKYAAANGIVLAGFELAAEGETARPDDLLTVLFNIQEGAVTKQWLGEFRMAVLTEREAKSKPGTGLGLLSMFQTTLKTDTGHEFSFEQAPVALEIRIHGPFVEGKDPEVGPSVTASRVLATKDYLAHGLGPMAKIELRLRAAGKKNPGISLMFRPKYSDEQMTTTKARTKEAGFTESDERAYAEAIYAIVQFGNLSFKTPGLDTITHELADSPTLFSGAFTNLVWPELQVEKAEAWGLQGMVVYRVPYNFLSKTKARGSFYFTTVRPPLQNMAGFMGLTIDSTSKNPQKRLTMRVLSGRRGPSHPSE